MKKVHVLMYLALLFLFCSALSQAQQGLASTRNDDSKAGSQGVSNESGSGAKDYVPLWLSATKLGVSNIYQSGGNVGIDMATPAWALDVNGHINTAIGFNLGGAPFAFGRASKQNAFLGFSGNSTMTGIENTATGVVALASNTTGFENTANGYQALQFNTTGYFNTATGSAALVYNTTGQQNTATGGSALQDNTTGSLNTATGAFALATNTTGYYNTAEGWSALSVNTTGYSDTASGYGALGFNSTGSGNTAVGVLALYYNKTGGGNTALGYFAGPDSKSTNLTNATAIGYGAVVSQSNSLVLGSPGVNVGIGTATPSNVFTIAQGAGQAISDGWSVYSSRRWKTNIQTLHGALEKVEQLRGVSYELKANGKHEVGVIAEEVGAVIPEVVTWEKNGKDAQSVDYSRLTALLIEATKEQQALIQRQQQQIGRLVSQIRTIQASLKTSGRTGSEVRTVKAQMETVHQ